MKQREQSDCRTVDPHRGEAGSIALEASLVLPVALVVIIFFVFLIQLSAVQMALHGAASQVTRQVAAHIYPIALAVEEASDAMPKGLKSTSPAPLLPGVATVADALARWVPEPTGPMLAAAAKGDWKTLSNLAAAEAGRVMLEPLLKRAADPGLLNPEGLRLYKLSLPDLPSNTDPYVRIQAEYVFPIRLPFVNKSIILREQSEERVWLADTVMAPRDGALDDTDQLVMQIVAIEPEPLNPGRKAKLILRTDPGKRVTLSVQYKSGTSKAKHLGEATADEKGYTEWSWHVSGNTTPGIWELEVTSENGKKVGRHFVVQKRQDEPSNNKT